MEKDRLKIKYFFEKLDKVNVVPASGLAAQGRISAIEDFLNDLDSYVWEKSKVEVCDKKLCKDYNTIFNRCKFQNGECSMKQI